MVKKFENYLVTNVSCGGCHTIISAHKTEEEFKKTINLPPLQRVPNAIIHEDSLHGMHSESIESQDHTEHKENGISQDTIESVEKEIKNEIIQKEEPSIIKDIKSPISAFTTEISDGIEEITTNVSETVISKKDEMTNLLDSSIHKMGDQMNEMKENVSNKMEGQINNMKDSMTHKIEGIKNGINQNMEDITSKTESFMGGMKEKVETSTQDKIDNFVKETKDGFGSEAEKFVNMTGVKSFLGNSKTDSIEHLLDEINDDDSKSSSGDTVSIISNGR